MDAAQSTLKKFDLPADSAEKSLKRLSLQSGVEILFATEMTAGVRTAPVKGEFPVVEAANRVLADTGLIAVQDLKTGTVTINRVTSTQEENGENRKPGGDPSLIKKKETDTARNQEPMKRNKFLTKLAAAAALLGGPPTSAHAQTTPVQPATTGANPATKETIVLSPFEVNASQDRGYYAPNTLSGTRLNSRMEDLASSISVVTKQQLLDTAAVGLDDVFLYEANTEGGEQFTNFSVDANRGVQDDQQNSPTTSNRVRGMGTPNISYGNFASENSIIPVDTYNVDAVEITRGPNSNIFGLGVAAGTINVVKSRAKLNHNSTQLTLRTDNRGSFRSSFDFNRSLGSKLSVRVSALYDDVGYVRKPSTDATRRAQGTFTFKPFKNTTIRGSYESFHQFSRRPNIITPRDNITPWIEGGKPTWDPVTFTATLNGVKTQYPIAQNGNLPYGLWSQGTSHTDLSQMYIDNGGVAFWTVGRLTTGANPTLPNTEMRYMQTGSDINTQRTTTKVLFAAPGFSDRSLYDWTSINAVARNYLWKKADISSFEVEQLFLNTPTQVLAANAGWYLEDTDQVGNNYLAGVASNFVLDINERLLDGTTNPYFLRPYISGAEPLRGFALSSVINDNVRAQLAYQLDLTQQERWVKWLGIHRLSGYWETRRLTTLPSGKREVPVSQHAWSRNLTNLGNGAEQTRVYYRYYVGDNQGHNVDYAPAALYGIGGTHDFYWRNGTTGQWITEPVTIDTVYFGAQRLTRREIRSKGLVVQDFLLNDRLVTILGWRRDDNRDRIKTIGVLDSTTGLYDFSTANALPWSAWNERAGTTTSKGAVLRPFRGWAGIDRRAEAGSFLAAAVRSLNLHYNESNTFQPAATAYNNFREELPQPTGNGKDYGFSLTLFDGKLNLRLNRYESNQIDSRLGAAAAFASRARRIDFLQAFSLETFAMTVIGKRFAAQGIIPTADQRDTEVAKFMGVTLEYYRDRNVSYSETQDVSSKGVEFEGAYNPNRFWTLKFNAAQQQTIDSKLAPNVQRWIDYRLPFWQGIKDDDGVAWFTAGGSESASAELYGGLMAPLRVQIANQGKPRSQIREWRFNATTSYQLAGLGTDRKWLTNLTIGGSARWEDKASIGFFGRPPDADGVIRDLDPNRPVYEKARIYFDAFASYRLRLFNDKVRARVQLNVRNMFEGGRLQAAAVNPDGTPYLYRIIDPRLFILTTTFDL